MTPEQKIYDYSRKTLRYDRRLQLFALSRPSPIRYPRAYFSALQGGNRLVNFCDVETPPFRWHMTPTRGIIPATEICVRESEWPDAIDLGPALLSSIPGTTEQFDNLLHLLT